MKRPAIASGYTSCTPTCTGTCTKPSIWASLNTTYARAIEICRSSSSSFTVSPLFQRQYVWNVEEHWEPLWEDIERKFVQRLDSAPSTPHFLGAMVLDQRRSFGNAVPVQLIIDGQQRLTTIQIFLSAFRDVCAAENQHAYADECELYLTKHRHNGGRGGRAI